MSTSRDDKILDFVEQNPDCTWTQIINHISPTSPTPTHKAIKRLVYEEKIIRSKDKNNSSVHHFRINDKNTFMRVFIRDLEHFREDLQNNNLDLKNSIVDSEMVDTIAFMLRTFEDYKTT